jgi:hypothetical protein
VDCLNAFGSHDVPPPTHTCLLIGDTQPAELHPVEALLRAPFPGPKLRRVERLSAARVADLSADLIVVCQSWSDEYTAGEVAALLSAAPLARILCVYGRWCDSDGRTRDVWPLAVRVPAAKFETRLLHELKVLAGTLPPLPLTATRTEIFAAQCRSGLHSPVAQCAADASSGPGT